MIYNRKNLAGYILNNYNKIKIMSYILGISVGEINYCLSNKNHRIFSPDRADSNPSGAFYWEDSPKGIKLRYRDCAKPEYNGDVFDKASIFMGLSAYDNSSFPKVCEFIINHYDEFCTNTSVRVRVSTKTNFEIIPYFRYLDRLDASIWTKWGISSEGLNICKIHPISGYSARGVVSKWTTNDLDPGYAISLGTNQSIDLWKLYFPLRSKYNTFGKHITNSYNVIEEYDPKQTGNLLIIFKSKKETAFFVSQCLKHNTHLPKDTILKTVLGESVVLPKNMINEISRNFKKTLLIFDNDTAGLAAVERFALIANSSTFTPQIPKKDLTDTYSFNNELGIQTFNKLITLIWRL